LAAKLSPASFVVAGHEFRRVVKIGQFGRSWFCHTLAMTTKTIPAYLEEERKKDKDAQQRIEKEAARIQLLQHGHHRTRKQPKPESPSMVKGGPKARKPAAVARKKPRTALAKASKVHKAA
jgi:hypothetical protein